MPSSINKLILKQMQEQLKDLESAVFFNYHRLTVGELNDLRTRLAEAGGDVSVIKNKIAKIVFNEMGLKDMDPLLSGPLSMVIAEDAISIVKVLVDFKKETKKGDLRFSYVEGDTLDKEKTEALAKLPGREELMSRISGMIKGVGGRVAASVSAPASRVAGAVKSIADSEDDAESTDAA